MVRIEGINLPDNKRVEIALTYIFGIGRARANKIIASIQLDKNAKVKDLTDKEINVIRAIISKEYKVEGDLKREKLMNIKRLKEIQAYRGVRHSRNLPVRGQRTKTNSRTVRGNVRRTMSSGKTKLTKT